MSAWNLRSFKKLGRKLAGLPDYAETKFDELLESFRGVPPDTFSQVLREELHFFEEQGRFHAGPDSEREGPPAAAKPENEDRPPQELAHRRQLVGLAFSGGGIRSATFNLGVLQALAHVGLLRAFHYLSTVSGGGYIGSWLVGWIHREQIDAVERELPREVEGQTEARRRRRHRRGSPITFLRQFSNYLTPKTGALSVDTWTAVATYVRNLVLNLTIVVLFLSVLLLLPRLLVAVDLPQSLGYHLFTFAGFLLLMAIAVVAQNYDSGRAVEGRHLTSTPAVLWFAAAPLFLAGVLASYGLSWLTREGTGSVGELSASIPGETEIWRWMAFAALTYFSFWLVALVVAFLRRRDRSQETTNWLWVLVPALVAGAGGGAALFGLFRGFVGTTGSSVVALIRQTIWGPPAVTLIFILTAVIHIGLMGRQFKEEHREWWSRLGGWLCILILAWAGLLVVVFYGPGLLRWLGTTLKGTAVVGWLLSTAAGIWAGRSPATGGRGSKRWVELVALVAPYVFVAGLVAALGVGIHKIHANVTGHSAERPASSEVSAWPSFEGGEEPREAEGYLEAISAELDVAGRSIDRDWRGLAGTVFLLLLVTVPLSLRVDINEFSMHLFYRNRLIRPYLGASRTRHPIPFTGFDPDDDFPLHDIYPTLPGGGGGSPYRGPLPILNTTVNLAAGEQLAWQERKANSFFFTPLHYGFDPGRFRGKEGRDERGEEARGERGEEGRGFRHIHRANKGKGITLGTAMAISGAAVNPNMGFHSSPALSFLLTVFNARLGWWMRNPAKRRGWDGRGPGFGLTALLSELTGTMGSESKFVNLADGGFFDNLGIYELVRRRCRFILACDAEADPHLEFAALGRAIRRCRSDFGIDIEIDVDPIRKDAATGFSRWHCAVGAIHYAEVDENAPKGTLVYLKASLTGDEPEDLQNYQRRFPDFPHESTADQWFGESQFESYRELGYHETVELFSAAGVEPRRRGGEDKEPSRLRSLAREMPREERNIETVFVELRQAWYPPSQRVEAAFTRHTKMLDEIFERLRGENELDFLDDEMYVEIEQWKRGRPVVPEKEGESAPEPAEKKTRKKLTDEQRRQGFYLCNSMIQLMENVYLDLDLEREWRHPDNRGWMNLFLHWSWSRTFRQTWSISASTYGARFQTFCQRRLGLEIGMVWAERLEVPEAPLEAGWAAIGKLRESRKILDLEDRLLDKLVENKAGEVYLLKVVVLKSRAAERLRAIPRFSPRPEEPEDNVVFEYTVGIASVWKTAKGRSISFLRIRDHLRRLGLGRASILRLIVDHGVEWHRVIDDAQLQQFYHRIDRARFGDLFKSVLNEYHKARHPRSWMAEVDESLAAEKVKEKEKKRKEKQKGEGKGKRKA